MMVTNVTSLLKTVKAVEDEATRGTRALEATIEHIRQELAVRDYHCITFRIEQLSLLLEVNHDSTTNSECAFCDHYAC